MTNYLRADTFKVTATIDSKEFGVFEGRTGGAGDSEETKVRLGGMGPQISLGGAQTMENLTLRRLMDTDQNFSGSGNDLTWLMAKRGKVVVECVNQPLDHDGNIHGRPFTYRGTLKQVTPPEHDANGTDPAYLELEVATDGTLA